MLGCPRTLSENSNGVHHLFGIWRMIVQRAMPSTHMIVSGNVPRFGWSTSSQTPPCNPQPAINRGPFPWRPSSLHCGSLQQQRPRGTCGLEMRGETTWRGNRSTFLGLGYLQRLSDLIGPYRGTYRIVYRVQPLLVGFGCTGVRKETS